MTEAAMRDVARRWLAGWSATSGHPWTDDDGVVRVEALMSSRRFEYLLVEPDDAQFDHINLLIGGDSRDVVTVFTNRPDHYLVPHTGLVVDRDDEALMTVRLGLTDGPMPAGFEVQWDDDGDRTTLHVVHGGDLAASGNLAVIGTDATFDRIETMPRYQRRGLGRFVMNALSGWALDKGAEAGLLAASADGQLLYESLGWNRECMMLMFRGMHTDPGQAGTNG